MDKRPITPALCAEFLRTYNHWRRGGLASQPEPLLLGRHIDAAIEFVRQHDDMAEQLRLKDAKIDHITNALVDVERERDELMAAAPELLAALNRITTRTNIGEIYKIAEEAIAKVEAGKCLT